ncbi:LPXTG cell wall anchor domain-containing protein [Dellaglioa sp. BT-FLS60]
MKKIIVLMTMLFLGFIGFNVNQRVNAATTYAGTTEATVTIKKVDKVTKPSDNQIPDRNGNGGATTTGNKAVAGKEADVKTGTGSSSSVVGGVLPQTNEGKSVAATMVGLILVLSGLLIFYIKRDKKQEDA